MHDVMTNRPLWLHVKHAVITTVVAAPQRQPIKYVLIVAGAAAEHLRRVPVLHMCVWGRLNLRLRSQERTTWVYSVIACLVRVRLLLEKKGGQRAHLQSGTLKKPQQVSIIWWGLKG